MTPPERLLLLRLLISVSDPDRGEREVPSESGNETERCFSDLVSGPTMESLGFRSEIPCLLRCLRVPPSCRGFRGPSWYRFSLRPSKGPNRVCRHGKPCVLWRSEGGTGTSTEGCRYLRWSEPTPTPFTAPFLDRKGVLSGSRPGRPRGPTTHCSCTSGSLQGPTAGPSEGHCLTFLGIRSEEGRGLGTDSSEWPGRRGYTHEGVLTALGYAPLVCVVSAEGRRVHTPDERSTRRR